MAGMLGICKKGTILLQTPVLYKLDERVMTDTMVKPPFTLVTCEMLDKWRSGYLPIESKSMSLKLTLERRDLRAMICNFFTSRAESEECKIPPYEFEIQENKPLGYLHADYDMAKFCR